MNSQPKTTLTAPVMRVFFSEDGQHFTFARPDCLDAFVLVSITLNNCETVGARVSFLSRVFSAQFPDIAARLRTAHRSGEAFFSVDEYVGDDGDDVVRMELTASQQGAALLVGFTHRSAVRPEVWDRFVTWLDRRRTTAS